MKNIIVTLTLLHFPLLSQAGRPLHPWMRICIQNNGQYELARTQDNEFAVCNLAHVALSAEALVIYKSRTTIPDAIHHYFQQDGYNHNLDCKELSATKEILRNPYNIYEVCKFADGSFLSLKSYQNRQAPFNYALDKALESTPYP